MVLSILVLLYIGFMAYWWGAQGAFSAFLHMMVVIVAGALAFGLWEPFAYFLLGTGSFATPFAWGLALLSLFVLFLVPLRAAMDRVAPKNMDFTLGFNHAVGGVFGLVAGAIVAGITILGFSFLPFGSNIMGYQSYLIEQPSQHHRPQVVPNPGGLWVPVDRFTVGLYTYLSSAPGRGAFVSGRPMGLYNPDLLKQAALFRMRRDVNGSVVAAPGSIEIQNIYTVPTPITEMPTLHKDVRAKLLQEQPPAQPDDGDESRRAGTAPNGDANADAEAAPRPRPNVHPDDRVARMLLEDGNQIVLIETKWLRRPGTFDADSQLRVPSTQVNLLAFDGDESHLHQPIAFVDQDHATRGEAYIERRAFRAIDTEAVMAFSSRQEPLFGWVFVIPQSQRPRFLDIRHTRFDLPDVPADPASPAELLARRDRMGVSLGLVDDPSLADADGAPRASAKVEFKLTADVPLIMSKNRSVRLNFSGPDNNELLSGEETVDSRTAPSGRSVRVKQVFAPPNLQVVRLKLPTADAQELFGKVRNATKRSQPVFLEDNLGEQWKPIGYILMFARDRSQKVRIDRDNLIESGADLPIDEMRPDDELHLYFLVRRGITIERVKVGEQTVLEPNAKVESQ
jgi:hypothetical protein